VCAVGYYVHFTAPWRSVPWIILVMVVAYAGQTVGAHVFDAQLSGFFGALAMTPLVLWIDATETGPPSLVTFLPGFWLLVPGAGGLISVTELVGTHRLLGGTDVVATVVSILAIALGVLIGTAAYRTAASGVQTIAATTPVQWFLEATENREHPWRWPPT
jgi:uncharacterized membrane protein YjjB (DUF3815 family)